MLYTVRPLERIYASPSVFNSNRKDEIKKDEKDMEYRDVFIKNGRLVTRRDGDNYVIEKINSTDMNDYLKEEYAPGKNYKL